MQCYLFSRLLFCIFICWWSLKCIILSCPIVRSLLFLCQSAYCYFSLARWDLQPPSIFCKFIMVFIYYTTLFRYLIIGWRRKTCGSYQVKVIAYPAASCRSPATNTRNWGRKWTILIIRRHVTLMMWHTLRLPRRWFCWEQRELTTKVDVWFQEIECAFRWRFAWLFQVLFS